MWMCDVLEGIPVILLEKWWRWWGVYQWESEGEECVYVCCVVLSENEKEKKNKNESDWPNREKRELWDMWWGRMG